MLIFFAVVGFLALVPVLVLLRNAPAWQASPGIMARLQVYLTQNHAELSLNNIFVELQAPEIKSDARYLSDEIRAVVKAQGWGLVSDNLPEGRLHAVISSPIMGFSDDLEVWLEKRANRLYLVHATSVSRLGKADFAANAAHLAAFREGFLKRMAVAPQSRDQ